MINLTKPFQGSIQRRGIEKVNIYKNLSKDGYLNLSNIYINLHSSTHIDLPWSFNYDVYETELNKKNIKLPIDFPPTFKNDYVNAVKLKKKLLKPKINVPCIIIDVSYKQKIIEDALFKIPAEKYRDSDYTGSYYQQFLNPLMEYEDFQKILHDICITKEELKSVLEGIKKPENTFLIFKTGWDIFAPDIRDLNHPMWECWHAFLIHPYLDENSIKYITDNNYLGIGCDTFSLECPLYYVDEHNALPYAQIAKKRLMEYGLKFNNITLPNFYKPMHLYMFSKGGLIIENLDIPKSDKDLIKFLKEDKNKISFETNTVTIFPFDLGDVVNDAALVNISLGG